MLITKVKCEHFLIKQPQNVCNQCNQSSHSHSDSCDCVCNKCVCGCAIWQTTEIKLTLAEMTFREFTSPRRFIHLLYFRRMPSSVLAVHSQTGIYLGMKQGLFPVLLVLLHIILWEPLWPTPPASRLQKPPVVWFALDYKTLAAHMGTSADLIL